jgi:DNA-binding transcriptional LysR family regulator
MITLKQLRHLQAIIRHGSIHRAAEVLYVTPPALTRSLGALENDLGIQLFDRSKNGMQATAFCLHIQERCAQLLCDTDELLYEAKIYARVDSGKLSLGVGRATRETVLRSVIPDFVMRYPKVQVHISEGTPEELIYGLKNRQFDLVIAGTSGLLDIDALRFQPMKSIPAPIFTRRAHPLARRSMVALAELLAYPMVTATQLISSHPLRRFLDQQVGTVPEPHVLCSDYQLLKQILLRTDAWMPAPLSQFATELAEQELHVLNVPSWKCDADISAIELDGRSRSPAAERLIELCLERREQW